jgi:lipoate-protein ligase A
MKEALEEEARAIDIYSRKPGNFMRFWETSEQCIVVPKGMATRSPSFPTACKVLAERGWLVYERCTGGNITPQTRGILNITQIFRASKTLGIDASYDRLCNPIEATLRYFGHKVARGSVPSAFCNGRHNVQIDGKKFAGTAQRRIACRDDKESVAILNHALLLVEPLSPAVFSALSVFQHALDDSILLQPDAHSYLSRPTLPFFLEILATKYEADGFTTQ